MKTSLIKKLQAVTLASALMLSFVGFARLSHAEESESSQETSAPASQEAQSEEKTASSEGAYTKVYTQAGEQADGSFVIAYPETIKSKPGFESIEDLKLAKRPEKIVVGSAGPVQLLHDISAPLTAIMGSKVAPWAQKWSEIPRLAFNHGQLDVEAIVSYEPDLIIVSSGMKEKLGQTFADAKIPVYYVDGGHTVSYESIKDESQALLDSFVTEENLSVAQEIFARFAETEKLFKEMSEKYKGHTALVLQNSAEEAYVQSKGGTLGSLVDKMGFENLYTSEEHAMAPMDPEQSIVADPEYIFTVGFGKTPEEQMGVFQSLVKTNEAYWNQYSAVKNGKVLAMPIDLIASYGYTVVDQAKTLADAIQKAIPVEGGQSES